LASNYPAIKILIWTTFWFKREFLKINLNFSFNVLDSQNRHESSLFSILSIVALPKQMKCCGWMTKKCFRVAMVRAIVSPYFFVAPGIQQKTGGGEKQLRDKC
jgi:hypothetical protein